MDTINWEAWLYRILTAVILIFGVSLLFRPDLKESVEAWLNTPLKNATLTDAIILLALHGYFFKK